MAGTITFSGLSSGLDTGSWVDALVSVKSTSITSLESQKAEKENLLSIVNNIKSYFTSFQTCLQKLTDSSLGVTSMDLFLQNLATSSNTNIATASATTEAARQSYDVLVDQLATSTKASSGYAKLEEKYATLDTKLGWLGAKDGTITVNDKSFSITTNDTIGSLLKKFENIGVEAKFDESKSLFTVGCSVDEIDEGSTNIKSALKLADKTVTGITSGSLVYANRDTEFSKLGLTGGKVMIAGEEHTITQNGDTYTINKDGEPAVDMNTIGDFLDYLTSSAVNAEEATIDSNGNIVIKGALLESVESGSNIIDILGLTGNDNRILMESNPLSYLEVKVADLDTSLAQLGIAADTTLVVEGSNNDITTDMKLRDIKTILNTAGIDFDIDSNGVITIDTHGKEISGTLLDVLGLNPSASGTTITSSPIQAQVAADGSTSLSTLGVGASDKYNVYSADGTLISSDVSGASSQTISEFVNTLKTTYGLDASFDEGSHKIIINDGYITGAVADALGVTRQTVSTSAIATTSSTLADIGITASKTLSINGGTAVEYGTGIQLSAIIGAISSAGGSAYLDSQGYLNVSGVQLSGTLVDALGLRVTGETTTITGGTHKYVSSVSSTGGILDTSGIVYDVDLNSKIGDITGSTNSYTLSVNGGEAVTYDSETRLSALQTQIVDAGGTFKLLDNVVTIEGVELSGTLLNALGFSLDIDTSYESSQINVTNTHVATRETELSTLGIGSDKQLSINGGEGKSYTTIGGIMDDIIAAGGSATLENGNLTISGVTLSGSLVDALGIVQTGETTSIESDYLSYVSDSVSIGNALDPSGNHNIDWDTEIGSITGTEDSYTLSVNGGTSTTYDSPKTLADIKDQIVSAGGTMVIDSVNNTIRIEGVESLSGTLLDALGLTPDISTTYTCSNITLTSVNYATDSTTLAELGISSDKELSINGGVGKSYTTIGAIRQAITDAGGSSTLEDGNLTVSGVTLSGSLLEALGIVETQAGSTTITSNQLSITSSTTTTSSETLYGSEVSGIDWNSTLGSILGEDTSALGFNIGGSEKSYTTSTKLSDIKSDIIAAGGTMELDTENNKIIISGVEVSGTLATALGLTNPTYTTSISSNTPIYVAGSTEVANASTTFGELNISSGNYIINSRKGNSSMGSYGGANTIGEFLTRINNFFNEEYSTTGVEYAAITAGGVISIRGGYVTGSLAEALGIGTTQEILDTTMTSSGIQYTEYTTSDWIGEIEIASGTGSIAVSSGTINTAEQKTGGAVPFGFIDGVTENNTVTIDSVSNIASINGSFSYGGYYLIHDASDLTALANLVNAGKETTGVTFILDNDIDLSSVSNFTPIGTSSNKFKGEFYGNGHVISNLTIDSSSDSTGLFGYIDGATIQDLAIVHAEITSSAYYTGGLVGTSYNSTISNCFVTGTVSGDVTVGGLIGSVNGGSIDHSYANVSVTATDLAGGLIGSMSSSTCMVLESYAIGNVTSTGNYVGGFCGEMDSNNTITRCYATGNVSGDSCVGGFAGVSAGTINNCYSSGTVTGTGSDVYGFIGSDGGTTLTNCVYNSDTGLTSGASSGVTGLTLAQMKNQSTMEAQGFTTDNGWTYTSGLTPNLGTMVVSTVYVSKLTGFTSGDTYHISTAEDLQKLAELVNAGNDTTGVTFILDNDIVLSPDENFTPIGTYSNAFKGEFYGNGHVIKNLTIDSSSDCTGLFGYTTGDIQDLGLENVNITGGTSTGALAGYSEGNITNCYVSGGTVSGQGTGGLVGECGNISYSYANVTVSGTSYVGGLVGVLDAYKNITHSYATGDVTGTDNYVGGLVGYAISNDTILHSYATGDVTGSDYVGGLIGSSTSSTITTSYSTGTVTGTGSNVGGFVGASTGTITNCVYNSGTGLNSGASSGVTRLTLLEIKTQSVMEGYGFTAENGWVYTTNVTPNFGNYTGTQTGVTMYVSELTGFTSGDTYHISTAADLQRLSELVNAGNDTTGVKFILDNDINLSSVPNFTPIGTSSNKFKGEFYGNGHTISKLTINSSSDGTGLFGYTDGATIQDLGVVDAEITSTEYYTGGLVGDCSNSTISNCFVTGTVSGASSVGGLIGFVDGGSIDHSYANVSVTATDEAGGLIGDMYSSGSSGCMVLESYAMGDVTATGNYVGGFCGYMSSDNSIIRSYATGNVRGANYVGGFAGGSTGGSINNCYSSGTVTGTGSSVYGFVGHGTGALTNCVYNSDIGLSSGPISGVTGLTLLEMKTQSVMEAQGFTTANGWVYSTGNTPGLCAVTGSTTQTLTSENAADVTLGQLSETADRNLSITVAGTTYSNTFTDTSYVQDVLDWINNNVSGVTASLESGNLTVQGNGEISASGGVWESLYTNASAQNTANSTQTINTSSRTLTYTTPDTIIDENTTVGDLMDAESGTFNITIGDFSGNYGCSTTLSTVLNDINNFFNAEYSTTGVEYAAITDGVFSVSGNGQFNISGELGLKLYGENGSTTHNPTYTSNTLSSTTSTVADDNTTLAELGVNSGNFKITDKNGNLITTIDITDSMKISDLNSAISSYGSVSITDGKVTATLNGAYRLEDGTSNLITKLKLNTYSDNTSNLTESSTLAQMGFGAGGTIEVTIDGVAQTPINLDGSKGMSDIISSLGALNITASVSNGKFTATSDHEFTLGGNLGSWLITGGTYDTTEAGYATSSPLSYNVSSNVSDATKVGDLMGNGTSGTVTVSINDGEAQSQTFTAEQDMSAVIQWLSETHGITASFDGNGNFTATGDVKFRLGGTIIEALQTNGTSYNHVDTLEGYDSGDLSYTTTEPASLATKLKEFDITSGTINIVDKDSNIIGTVTLDANNDFSTVNSQLEEYGIVLSFDSNHKIVANSSNNYRISDDTSNFVEKTGLNTWNENVVEVSGSTKLNQIGFGSGGTIDVTIGGTTKSLTLNDGTTDLNSVISQLKTFVQNEFGVSDFNASITNGIFTATSDHSFTLGGDLGNYLTSNGVNGYQTISAGYATSSPLTYTTTSKMSGSTKIGDFMGDGGNGTLTVSINDGEAQSKTFTAEQDMNAVIQWLGTHGITASINETTGQMTATSTDKFRLGGTIADILGGSYNDDYTYVSDDLSWSPAGDVTMDTTLKDLGISSGNINVVDGDGNIVSPPITVDENDTLTQVAAKLPSYMTMSLGSDKKITVTATGNYRLADDTSNMVSKLGLTTWNEIETNISDTTKLNQIGFGSGGTIDVTINGTTKSLTLNDGTTDLNSVISQLKTFVQNEFGVSKFNASITNGKFTATSDHEFTLGGNLGNYLISGSANGYVTTADGYKTESPLMTGADNYRAESEELVYNTAMTTESTLEQLGLSSGGTLNVNKGGSYTPYNLGKDTKIQDIIDILANNHNITASVDSNGKFTATSTDETFTLSGTIADILTQGGTYINTTTGYTSDPLSYNSNGAVDTSTKLTDLGVATGDVYIIENDVATGKDISITNDTTIGQFFNALSVYGMQGSIETNAAGESFIRITSDTNTKLVNGTSDLVTKLGLNEIRQGDFTGNVIYWDDNATSGLVTEDMLITSFDKGGFSAVGTLSFQTGTGDDAVSHTITITDKDTVGTFLQKLRNEGVNAELDNGIIKISAGLDTITLTGGTSGLVSTIGLDVQDTDTYAQSSEELKYEGLSSYSAANYADGDTLLSTVNITDGIMSIYVDGIRCTVEVDSTQTFSNLFSAISDEIALKTGLTAKVGFLDKNGDVVQNPQEQAIENNTGIVSILVEGDHKVVVGASNDKTNFATIANLVNSNENNVTGSRALFKVNASSKITDSGLFRAGDITEGSFKIGDATFTIDSETTISDLVQQINRSEKSYASAYWDSLSGTLVLQSTETGESLINIEAIDSNFTNIMGFTQTKDGVDSLVTENQKLGSNAQVRINGTAITCDKNVIKSEVSKIKGLTINLKNVSAGETVTITVEQDKDSIYNAVSDTIDAYNAMMEALNKELADRDSLGGESVLKLMRNNLKRLMTSTVSGTYVYRNMSAVGISTGEARNDVSTDVTSLIIDKDKFMDALTNDSDAVKTLLIGSQANPGVFLQANSIVTKALSTSGYFSNTENTLSKNITNLDKKISKTTMFVENYRARLEKQFKLMESTISGLQNAYANLLNG